MSISHIICCSECNETAACTFLKHNYGGGRWICHECEQEIDSHICANCGREGDIDFDTSTQEMMPICIECSEDY